MLVAGATEGIDELAGALERPRELLPWDLEPSDVIVVADAKPAKPKASHRAFGRCHLP